MTSLDRIFRCSAGLLLVGLIAACGTSSNGASGEAGDAGTASDAGNAGPCDSYFTAALVYSQRCTGRYDPSRSNDLRQRFDAQCAASLSAAGDTNFANYLGACSAATQAAACGVQPTACELDTVTGSLTAGASCAASTQCESSYCDFSGAVTPSNQNPSCGKCIARIADGQPCGTADTGSIIQCVVQDECDNSTPTKPGTCTAKPAQTISLGGACGPSVHASCVVPNFCDVGNTKTCIAPLAAGGSCQVTDECSTGLVCNRLATAQTGTCITPVGLGGTCVLYDCASGLGCDVASSKCVSITYAQPGDPCDGDGTRCSHSLCDFASSTSDPPIGICPTIIPDNQACSPTDQSRNCDDFAACTNNLCTLGIGTCP